MIYLDTSVALAHLFAEDRRPTEALWKERLVSSRLLEYELWNRFHATPAAAPYRDDVKGLLAAVSFFELSPTVLARALEPFPVRVRTLDAFHLATMLFAMDQGQKVRLATYDRRMLDAARALAIPLVSF